MNKVSLFKELGGKPFKNITILEAIERIKSGHNIKHIEKLREANKNNDTKQKDYIKKNDLWSVTWGGVFEERKADKLVQSSGVLILDFDHVQDPEFVKQYVFYNYYECFASWISPSGDGVKVLFKIPEVNSDAQYKGYYNSIIKSIDDTNIDKSTTDISRLCFESYDPNLLMRDWEKTSEWDDFIETEQNKVKPVSIKPQFKVDPEKVYNIADRMIQTAKDGEKRHTLLKASRLIGGYVAGGLIPESDAIIFLETSIQNRDIDSFDVAKKAIRSGLEYGKQSPLNYDFQQDYTPEVVSMDFPIDIFPEMYQKLINKLDTNLNFPVDYTATAILFAYSVLMGNRFAIHVKSGYKTVPMCWFAVVGEPGVTKSHPINTILRPIKDWDYNSYVQYKVALKDWEQIEDNREKKPMFKKHLIDDFTIESLPKIINANQNGIGIYADELASWVNNIDRYSNSSNMSKFLSIFDNGNLIIDRKTMEPEYVKNVFLSIIGTIQPDVLIDLFDKYSGNGFIDRFLFSYPDARIKPLSLENIEIDEISMHELMMNDLINTFKNCDNFVYKFENLSDLIEINNWLIDRINDKNTNARMINYIAKLVSYIPRLAIIIETINYTVVNEYLPTIITTNSMKKTKELIKYFFNSAEKLLVTFNKKIDAKVIINGYRYKYEKVQALRKNDFSFKEIGKILNISEQAAKNYNYKSNQNKDKK